MLTFSTDIYLFSGLGADQRVFQSINIPLYNLIYIQWIEPNINESMESYAERLLTQIKSLNTIFLGVSFGGIMAIEVAKLIEVEKVILIS